MLSTERTTEDQTLTNDVEFLQVQWPHLHRQAIQGASGVRTGAEVTAKLQRESVVEVETRFFKELRNPLKFGDKV